MSQIRNSPSAWLFIAVGIALLPTNGFAQAPAAGPPPSVANEPLPEPAAEELHAAARRGDVAVVKALLEKGVSANARWRYGMTALFPACDRGHIEVVKLLLANGVDVKVRDSFYNATALVWALNKGHVDVVKLLLENGAENDEGVLMTGVNQSNVELVKLSLSKGGLAPDSLTAALSRAVRTNKPEVAEALKAGGAPSPAQLDASTLAEYAGTYSSADGTQFTFRVQDGYLEATAPGRFIFAALDETTFRPETFGGVQVKFVREEGRVTSITVRQGNQETTAKRVEAKP